MSERASFEDRRKHLASMNDQELKNYFWKLTQEVVSPIIDLARTHTSPSIERSVLLRMGFSSLEAKEILSQCIEHQWLGKGVGQVVLTYSKLSGLPYREAGLKLAAGEGWGSLNSHWKGDL